MLRNPVLISHCGNIAIIRVYVNALYGTNHNPAVMQMLSHRVLKFPMAKLHVAS